MRRLRLEDGSVWPWPAGYPSDDDLGLEWWLRYGLEVEREHALAAASVVAAYTDLVTMPKRQRDHKIRMIKAALTTRTPSIHEESDHDVTT